MRASERTKEAALLGAQGTSALRVEAPFGVGQAVAVAEEASKGTGLVVPFRPSSGRCLAATGLVDASGRTSRATDAATKTATGEDPTGC